MNGLVCFLALWSQSSIQPPDVVLIIGDDIALTDVQAVETPTLDFLAAAGVEFTRAHAHPLCTPTRRSLFFGRWAADHAGAACLPPTSAMPLNSEFSLAKMFKGAGYSAAAFGKWHLGTNVLASWEVTPELHGFDTWRAGIGANVYACGGGTYSDWLRVDSGVSQRTTLYQTDVVRDEFIDWWQSTPGPRFAYVAYQSAHSPFHVPPGFPDGTYTDREKYELMIRSLDSAIADMLNVIDLADTIVIFLGDNGTPTNALPAGQTSDRVKRSTFRDGVVVPMIAAGPGIGHGVCSELVHVVDFMATLADLIGQPLPRHLELDSVSFAGALREPTTWRAPRPFVYVDNGVAGLARDRAVVMRRFKYRIAFTLEEAYNVLWDPDELAPLDLTNPALDPQLAALRTILADPRSATAYFR